MDKAIQEIWSNNEIIISTLLWILLWNIYEAGAFDLGG